MILKSNIYLFNQKKIKFPDDRKYLGKTLDIKCVIKDIEIAEQFDPETLYNQ